MRYWRHDYLSKGVEALLAQHPLEADESIDAVDASVWARCDAETSPERAFYHHPSRHSAGQPIVAGWAYHWIAQISFAHESWTAPRKIRRLRPGDNVNLVAVEQIKEMLQGYPESAPLPIFVFDAGDLARATGCWLGFTACSLPHALAKRRAAFTPIPTPPCTGYLGYPFKKDGLDHLDRTFPSARNSMNRQGKPIHLAGWREEDSIRQDK